MTRHRPPRSHADDAPGEFLRHVPLGDGLTALRLDDWMVYVDLPDGGAVSLSDANDEVGLLAVLHPLAEDHDGLPCRYVQLGRRGVRRGPDLRRPAAGALGADPVRRLRRADHQRSRLVRHSAAMRPALPFTAAALAVLLLSGCYTPPPPSESPFARSSEEASEEESTEEPTEAPVPEDEEALLDEGEAGEEFEPVTVDAGQTAQAADGTSITVTYEEGSEIPTVEVLADVSISIGPEDFYVLRDDNSRKEGDTFDPKDLNEGERTGFYLPIQSRITGWRVVYAPGGTPQIYWRVTR